MVEALLVAWPLGQKPRSIGQALCRRRWVPPVPTVTATHCPSWQAIMLAVASA